MASISNALLSALTMAFAMGSEILWPLILGFALSGVVQAVVTKAEMSRLLPDSSPRSIVIASALGDASSSCSYAAVLRSPAPLLRPYKGGDTVQILVINRRYYTRIGCIL